MGFKNSLGCAIILCFCGLYLICIASNSQAAIPASPINLTAISGNDEASLTWTKVTGADAYIVYRSDDLSEPFTYVGRTKVNCFANVDLDIPVLEQFCWCNRLYNLSWNIPGWAI